MAYLINSPQNSNMTSHELAHLKHPTGYNPNKKHHQHHSKIICIGDEFRKMRLEAEQEAITEEKIIKKRENDFKKLYDTSEFVVFFDDTFERLKNQEDADDIKQTLDDFHKDEAAMELRYKRSKFHSSMLSAQKV